MLHLRGVRMFLGALTCAFVGGLSAQGTLWENGQRYTFEEVIGGLQELQGRFSEAELELLEKLNRRDTDHLAKARRVLTPKVWAVDELTYSPLPSRYGAATQYGKLLVVHVPMQVFGAYESGRLKRWGPVSTGKRESQTPEGFFHLNWRSVGRYSSIDPDWFMPWYFNFDNARGLSFHQYALPGRPASHACIRLLERDAEWLYQWGEPSRINASGTEIMASGIPVLIVGHYDFDSPPPWESLDSHDHLVSLPADLMPLNWSSAR